MGKGIKIKAPKIKIGKDLGTKNLGKGLSSIAKNAGKVGSQVVKTVGKGAEGIVGNTADIAGAIAKGDFKGIGKEGLELLQSGKDVVKGLGSAGLTAAVSPTAALGAATGSKDLTKTAANIEREGNKGINKYGDAAIDMGLSAVPGVGQAYALAKMGAGGLAKDGLSSLTSMKGLQDMAIQAGASKFGYDPNLVKMGLSAAQGDVKGAALQGLSSYGGFDPKMLNMGVSALTGDKGGLASGLASQFGAGDSAANMLGSVAGGDLKGAALQQIAGTVGLDPKLISNLSQGKMNPMELVKGLGGLTSGMGVNALSGSSQAAGEKGFLDNLKEGFGQGIGKVGEFFSGESAPTSYTINKGDTFNDIARRMGVSVEELRAANPNIKDPNKIAAGGTLNLPSKGSGEGFFDQAGKFISSAGSKALDFARKNPSLVEGAIQLAGAKAGYDVTNESNQRQQEIYQKQLEEAQNINDLRKFQYDPRRAEAYDQSYGFQQQRIAQGGFTDAEKAQQRSDDLRSAKMRQAARMAGVRTLAEKGQGASGAGDAYLQMLAGMQDAADVGSQMDIARQKQASENLEKAYATLPEMMEKKSKSEMDLASERSSESVSRTGQLATVRTAQATAESQRGTALANLAGQTTNTISKLAKDFLKPAEEDATKKQTTTQTATTRAPASTPSTQTKAGGAAIVAGNTPPPTNMATGELGSGAGVLATPNADAMNQSYLRYTPAQQPQSGVQQVLSGASTNQPQQPMMSVDPALQKKQVKPQI